MALQRLGTETLHLTRGDLEFFLFVHVLFFFPVIHFFGILDLVALHLLLSYTPHIPAFHVQGPPTLLCQ